MDWIPMVAWRPMKPSIDQPWWPPPEPMGTERAHALIRSVKPHAPIVVDALPRRYIPGDVDLLFGNVDLKRRDEFADPGQRFDRCQETAVHPIRLLLVESGQCLPLQWRQSRQPIRHPQPDASGNPARSSARTQAVRLPSRAGRPGQAVRQARRPAYVVSRVPLNAGDQARRASPQVRRYQDMGGRA